MALAHLLWREHYVSFIGMNVTDEGHHFEVLPSEKLKIAKETTCLVLWESAANWAEKSFKCQIQPAYLFCGYVHRTDIGKFIYEKS